MPTWAYNIKISFSHTNGTLGRMIVVITWLVDDCRDVIGYKIDCCIERNSFRCTWLMAMNHVHVYVLTNWDLDYLDSKWDCLLLDVNSDGSSIRPLPVQLPKYIDLYILNWAPDRLMWSYTMGTPRPKFLDPPLTILLSARRGLSSELSSWTYLYWRIADCVLRIWYRVLLITLYKS